MEERAKESEKKRTNGERCTSRELKLEEEGAPPRPFTHGFLPFLLRLWLFVDSVTCDYSGR